MSIFINREQELTALNKFYREAGAQLVIVWGRRRIGKTELIKRFVENKSNYLYLAKSLPTNLQVEEFLKEFCERIAEPVPKISAWKEAFSFILKKLGSEKKVVIAIDEFPYAIQSDKATLSYFQDLWDNYLIKENIMLILLGSSIGMMESYVLGYQSPLYGRRSGQIKLERLKIKYIKRFFPNKPFQELIYIYSIVDAIPAYLLKFKPDADLWENISENFLDFSSFLFQEPQILLKEELREPITYFRILEAIANLKFKITDIANAIQVPAHNLPKYLKVLEELGFIEKLTPATIKKPKIKETLYKFRDNFFNFYFRYIFPHTTDINRGDKKYVIDLIKRDLDNYTSLFVFESVCKEYLLEKPPFRFQKLGTWWHKDKEIDIVVLNEKNREILFAECKWQGNVSAYEVLAQLKEKARHVQWYNEKRKEYYAIFAKSFKKKIKEENVLLYELKNLEKLL